ncbi:Phosphohistidine phosphatase SixA (SixA) (PDB:1UJB) [Commensalibacter communis]|uniref:Phosphohistidine phosphatase SixA (SixA) n=1 Tax=Commensalibacter communis TaxID=2972786 RepID=A0A9W4TM41_9PROT|nr:histidine phosphatase family protein [Commensalibacter communis]CAI3922718.1 Phosphohistidine phosphatase SixA (SixA) (PDB:1UJB) [Commensalibacter communis]CAI3924095.1 Phosphohistidine phosphatase SixA (SixA) (PDB:1UJB) [Commensalibacter communis]CAI3924162.1 Phosphohistidine phosphatase SixA (SixA) (PDB:1UJB) [Commensalibacter communis]CAI3930541.1 Phosphohistidine phosphatase SixA (SixA) (PDB:1UJB) [Commensalibacter communis]CAI3930592.1 Phosphohistidine phosphatase SixA (SixA) (PDB:1UJB
MPTSSYLTLFILRHAKASDHANTDFDRPLTKKGQQQAIEKGTLLKNKTPLIDTILCSAAKRTAETLSYLDINIDKSQIITDNNLYLCDPEILLACTQQITHGKSALIIGHNPGLHQFAYDLLSINPLHQSVLQDSLSRSLPKCALVEIHFYCENWSEINWHQGLLSSYHP